MKAICGKVIRQLRAYLFLDFSKTSVTQKQYVKLRNPKRYPLTKFWISTSHNIQIMSVAGGQVTKPENRRWHTVANRFIPIINCVSSVSYNIEDMLSTRFQMVGQIYPTELQLNKANSSDTEAPFLDLNLSITNGIVSSKIYDKRDGFNFEIVIFPFLDGDVPRSPSYGVYISQLIRFARVCSNVDDFNNRNLFLTAKLL